MTVAPPYTPPPPPGGPAPKKGMGPLGYIAIGCGALVLLGFIAMAVGGYFLKKKVVDPLQENPAMAAAELVVRNHPELELVSSDREKGTMTIKNIATNEVVTINAEDIQNGKISFETAEGKTVVDASSTDEGGNVKMTGADGQEVTWGAEAPKDLPAWVPVYPGGTVQGALDSTSATEGRTATFTVSTDATIDELITFYESKLKEGGLNVSKNVMESNGERGGMLTGTSEDEKRSVVVMIGMAEGKAQANVNFTAKP